MVTKAQIDQLKTIERNLSRDDINNFLIQNHITRIHEWNQFLNDVRGGTASTLWNPVSMVYQEVDLIVNAQGILTQKFAAFRQDEADMNALINQNPIDDFEVFLQPVAPPPPLPTVDQLLVQGIQTNEITGSLLLFGDSENW